MNASNKFITTIALSCLLSGAAIAAPMITFTDENSYNTTAPLIDSIDGSDMQGMQVTTCFVTDICETISWNGAVNSAIDGEAVGSNWKLSVTANTFSAPFTFQTLNGDAQVTSISLNGRPGNTVFDVIAGDHLSPGSEDGEPFFLVSSSTTDLRDYLNINYTDRLSVADVFYGDLYTVMNIDFSGQTFNGTFSFYTDTDSFIDIVAVPLSGTLFMFVTGLMGLGLRRKLKK